MFKYIRNSDEKQRWLFASVMLNATLSVAKLGWGWMMSSTLIIADGIHSISDVFGALLIFLALLFAGHKSKQFPYGLHKLEDMAALLGGIGILFAGYEIIHSVFFETGVMTPENIWSTVGFVLVVILIQYIFYIYELKAAKRLNSPGVKADAVNWLGDIGAGTIVVLGLIAHHYHVAYAQEVAVIIIVLMIFKGAYDVLKEALFSLLDAVDTKLDARAYDILIANPDITEIKRLNIRKSGSVYFADIELKILNFNAAKAHKRIDLFVDELHNAIPELEAATIHYEPDHPSYQTIVRLLDSDKEHLSNEFGRSPWLEIIHEESSGEVLSREIISNPTANDSKGRAFKLVAKLLLLNTDKVILSHMDADENIVTLFDALDIELVTQTEESSSREDMSE
ncbi:cation diffusion facilitator family transporter [Thiomicrorhabdus sp. Milos-T2]|uniref:cation diffusion facilitator family transporter n=1 Tax=Thiomicrorhabdus sp. Milos-T2 TaxID=90814 RepID=UPI000691B9CF|nr:cation diffusion facilitator family transporter [Thiomicrorhabdus sp. Milos-T2]